MDAQKIIEAVLALDGAQVARRVEADLTGGADAMAILNQGLIAAMDDVGERYTRGTFYVPEMLAAAGAMKQGLALLRPHLAAEGAPSRGRVVIGTVKGDRHDIGKNLVAMMLECAGFEVIDLGVDVDGAVFLEAAVERKARIVAMSALLTTTMPAMEAAVSRIRNEASGIQTVVGGAPVTRTFADRIGAQGYSPDAPGAVAVCRRLVTAR